VKLVEQLGFRVPATPGASRLVAHGTAAPCAGRQIVHQISGRDLVGLRGRPGCTSGGKRLLPDAAGRCCRPPVATGRPLRCRAQRPSLGALHALRAALGWVDHATSKEANSQVSPERTPSGSGFLSFHEQLRRLRVLPDRPLVVQRDAAANRHRRERRRSARRWITERAPAVAISPALRLREYDRHDCAGVKL